MVQMKSKTRLEHVELLIGVRSGLDADNRRQHRHRQSKGHLNDHRYDAGPSCNDSHMVNIYIATFRTDMRISMKDG